MRESADLFKKNESKLREKRKFIFSTNTDNKKILTRIIIIIIISVPLFATFYQRTPLPSESPDLWSEQSIYIEVEKVYELFLKNNSDLLLVNTSEKNFYHLGHITGSMLIPASILEKEVVNLDVNKHIVLFSYPEETAIQAYNFLKTIGYKNLWVMQGGLSRWITRKYPTNKIHRF